MCIAHGQMTPGGPAAGRDWSDLKPMKDTDEILLPGNLGYWRRRALEAEKELAKARTVIRDLSKGLDETAKMLKTLEELI